MDGTCSSRRLDRARQLYVNGLSETGYRTRDTHVRAVSNEQLVGPFRVGVVRSAYRLHQASHFQCGYHALMGIVNSHG
jgi:hypothetical protein